jgi:hypothetical protein
LSPISAPQAFVPRQTLQRNISIQGMDFQYFFVQRNFYALTYLAMDAGATIAPLAATPEHPRTLYPWALRRQPSRMLGEQTSFCRINFIFSALSC